MRHALAALLLVGCPDTGATDSTPSDVPDAGSDASWPAPDASEPDAGEPGPAPEPDAGDWRDEYCDRPLLVGDACEVTERVSNGNQSYSTCNPYRVPTACEDRPELEQLTIRCAEVCTFGCDAAVCTWPDREPEPAWWENDAPTPCRDNGVLVWQPDSNATDVCGAIGGTCRNETLADVTRSWCLP